MTFTIDVDKTKNRLTLILEGFISQEEGRDLQQKMESAVKQLNKGFTMLVDQSKYRLTSDKGMAQEIMGKLGEWGLKASGIVISESAIGKIQMKHMAQEVRRSSRRMFDNRTEAIKWLDSQ